MSAFAPRLLAWYRAHARILPWRGLSDAYAIWVSEIMLQQTRVETAIPYFHHWMRRFPTIKDLAEASERDVLRLWEGLGYYSRARNLHKAAKIIIEKYDGQLPHDLNALHQLPGIGQYTMGAIASIAFGMDVPALDGNIRRVFARVFNVEAPADSPSGEKILWDLVTKHLPEGIAGDYNQALMDLGAMVCLPKKPSCLICPVKGLCEARREGIQDQRPVLRPKKKTPHYILASVVVVKNGHVLLAKRPSYGLLGGTWEFPNGRVNGDPFAELSGILRESYHLKIRRKDSLGVVTHAYSHFKVTVHVFRGEYVSMSKNRNLKWVTYQSLDGLPMGKVNRRITHLLPRHASNPQRL
jgi:A/G-specific adenine glycosylase